MTPATHAAVAALVSTRCRNLGVALGASFGLHFLADALYHFEAFYPLSVAARSTSDESMWLIFLVLAMPAVVLTVWLARRDLQVGSFAAFGLALSMVPFDPSPARRIVWALVTGGFWWVLSRNSALRRWVLCGFFGYLPDLVRRLVPPLNRFHEWTHYETRLDLGDWISLIGRGRWQIAINDRIWDPYYQAGYALQLALEAVILFGSLGLLLSSDRSAPHPPPG